MQTPPTRPIARVRATSPKVAVCNEPLLVLWLDGLLALGRNPLFHGWRIHPFRFTFYSGVPLHAADRQQPAPHLPHRDQIQALGRHTLPGQPMGIEQHLVIEGRMTPSAMRSLHAPPGCGTPRAGHHRSSGIVPTHRRSKAASPDRARERHDSAATRIAAQGVSA
jgi:hypothetical protein